MNHRQALLTLLAILTVTASVSSASAEDSARARQQIDAARELYAAGNWDTAIEAYTEARAAAKPRSLLDAEATIELASITWEQGDYARAHKLAKQAVELAKELKLDDAVGRLMLTLGHIEASQGKLGQAESTLQICVSAAKKQRDQNFEALCRINLRFVRQLRGKSVPSERQYRKDLTTLKRSGQSVLVGTALAKSAELQEKARDLDGALATLRKAHEQFVAAASQPSQARNRLRLAQTLQNLGRWDEAAKELDGLVLTFRNMKSRPSLVTAYALRGKQRAQTGNAAGALKDYTTARKTAGAIGSPQLVANADLALCEYHALANDVASARKFCAAASKGFAKVGIPALAARSHILVARLAQQRQEWLQARADYVEALRILSEEVSVSSRDAREIAVQKVNLCQVEMKLEAGGAFKRCRDASKDLDRIKATDAGFRSMLAATKYALGATAPADQRTVAIASFTESAKLWKALQNAPQAADALLRLGKLQANSSKSRKQAIATYADGLATLGQPADDPQRGLAIALATQKAQAELDVQAWKDADRTCANLIGWATATKDADSAAWAHSARAQALLKLGKRDEAIATLREGQKVAKRAKDRELASLIDTNLAKLTQK